MACKILTNKLSTITKILKWVYRVLFSQPNNNQDVQTNTESVATPLSHTDVKEQSQKVDAAEGTNMQVALLTEKLRSMKSLLKSAQNDLSAEKARFKKLIQSNS